MKKKCDCVRHFVTMGPGVAMAMMLFIMWTLTNIGYYYDAKPQALALEVARCVVSLAAYQSLAPSTPWASLSTSAFTAWMGASLAMAITLSVINGASKNKSE